MVTDTTQAVRIKTVVLKDGVLHLEGPFHAGDAVEVIVLREESATKSDTNRYPLRGSAVKYIDPFNSAVEDAWEADA